MPLPQYEVSFDFSEIGADTGKKYEGTFTIRCILSIAQKHALELNKTRLCGGLSNPTDELLGLSIILSNLRARIIKGAPFWEQALGDDIMDEEIIVKLYSRVQTECNEWKQKLQDQKASQ